MDLAIGRVNFCIGSLGSVRLSDPINSGPSAGKNADAVTSKTSVGSSSEINSPVSIMPMNNKRNTMKELGEIMKNLDLEESSGYSDMASNENLDNINNYSEEDFMACYGNISGNSKDTWRLGLKLRDDEHTVPSSGSGHYDSNRHQVCVIINDTSEEFVAENNPIMNPQNLERGAKHKKKEKQSQPLRQGKKFTSQQQNGR
jgi:hypothetical protein